MAFGGDRGRVSAGRADRPGPAQLLRREGRPGHVASDGLALPQEHGVAESDQPGIDAGPNHAGRHQERRQHSLRKERPGWQIKKKILAK